MDRRGKIGGICLLVVSALLGAGGCTRTYYRKQADRAAFSLLREKDQDPRWKIDQFHVYPDPRARFADWTNPDHPPMPPDDPAAKWLSPNPQKPGKPGVEYIEGTGYLQLLEEWNTENRRLEAEQKKKLKRFNPEEEQEKKSGKKKMIGPAGPTPPVIDALDTYELQNELAEPVGRTGLLPATIRPPTQKKQPYLITLDQAVELAQINSRELQTAREELYLSALPVTLERFAFAAQFFAIEQVVYQTTGFNYPNNPGSNWAPNTLGGFSKLFSTGALLMTQFANQTVINLGTLSQGTIRTTSQSAINLDLVQPFLRGGGRAVTLEPLTQTERDLLYAVRDFARFRQGFYTFIAVGQAAFIVGQSAGVSALPPGTINTPNPFVPNSTPVATGTLAPAGPVQIAPGAGGRLGAVNPFGANPQGYLQTLAQKVQQIIARKNVASYEYFFKLFQIYLEGGIVNPVQVGQVEKSYLSAVENQLTQWVQYRQALDLFRIQLGLPTTLPVELDDGPIQPMYDLLHRYEDNSTAYAYAVNEVGKYDKIEEARKLRPRLHEVFAKSHLVDGLPFQKEAPARWAAWEKLKTANVNAKLRDLRGQRRKLQDRKADLEIKGNELSAAELQGLEKLDFDIDLGEFELLLRKYDSEPWKAVGDAKKKQQVQSALFGAVQRSFAPLLAGAAKERLAQIRAAWPALPPVYVGELDLLSAEDDTALDTVVRTALLSRLDLMNQRAELVDSWRKLRVAANALFGTFNVEYHMDGLTPPGVAKPFAFSSSQTRHDVVFNSQLPIVRIAERNNYRSALIAYQQQRRAWMDAQDQIAFAVRFQLRNLRIAAYNYQKVQRRNMELAYLLVDQALQAFNQPAAPTGGGGLVSPPGGQPTQGDAAALTQQLLTVQGSLVAAQNDLFNQWLGYLQNRINLYRDLGLMPLDSRGIWVEDVTYFNPDGPDTSIAREGQCGNQQLLSPARAPNGPPEFLPPARLLNPSDIPPADESPR